MRSAQRILDATVEVIARDGFDAVNMAAVAKAAGVSRQTVYSNFGTREDLVSQAMIAVAVAMLDDVRSRLPSGLSGGEYVVEMTVACRGAIREHPAFARLLMAGAGSPLFDEGVLERARPLISDLLRESPEPLPGAGVDEVAELVTRLALSVFMFDSEATREDDGLRTFLRRWMVPALQAEAGLDT